MLPIILGGLIHLAGFSKGDRCLKVAVFDDHLCALSVEISALCIALRACTMQPLHLTRKVLDKKNKAVARHPFLYINDALW